MTERDARIAELRAARPRSRFVRASLWLATALLCGSWLVGDFSFVDLLSERRLRNLDRFLGELVPYPVRESSAGLGAALEYYWAQLQTRGWDALWTTFSMSVAAIALAGLLGTAFSFLAARNVASPEPFLPAGRPPSAARRSAFVALVGVTRFTMMFLRAIPEYVWAFLLILVFGPSAWPAVLALAMHNAGILGRLGAEVLENVPVRTPAAIRGLGATRAQLSLGVLFPKSLNRFLLFFFYRWETCVREATVLGLLGIVSLGYWVRESRAAYRYDEMIFFVVLAIAIVLVGDLVSAAARAWIRRAA